MISSTRGGMDREVCEYTILTTLVGYNHPTMSQVSERLNNNDVGVGVAKMHTSM